MVNTLDLLRGIPSMYDAETQFADTKLPSGYQGAPFIVVGSTSRQLFA